MADFHSDPKTIFGFNIDNFRSIVGEAGVLKPTKFLFSCTPPLGLVGGQNNQFVTNAARNLQFWASTATIPGIEMITHEVRRYGHGPSAKKPWSSAFSPIQITFNSDGLGATWTFFKQWINLAQSFDMSKGVGGVETKIGGGVQSTYEGSYPDDYTVDIVVSAFVDTGEEILRVVMRSAYPILVGDTHMDWGDNGTLAKFSVAFDYVDWYTVNLNMQQNLGISDS